ncbi:hypothetical protein FZ934_09315 [Rhizobium grahamii]|uniref:Uncharacterized protein n=1 Tax=Rhizobium grahamii TaxID=1120045 RepID=A0A5Q0C3Y1_9HYPH|nr:hypothetical protein FZ934_09315 [Rhizobium grahamii]QRM50259.1 hypothetical protein F3Y33_13575 [Rhizobium sp. BG6]
MTNFTLKGILYGLKQRPGAPVSLAKQGMTAEIQCISCGKTFKRWSMLSSSITVCDECLPNKQTAH